MLFQVARRFVPTVAARAIPARSATAFVAPARAFSAAAVRYSADHHNKEPEILQGPGTADSNHIPSNFDQATGLERYEMMAELEGRKPWDIDPIVPAKIGTAKEPIVVESVDDFRLIGCSGFPAESHDLIWIRVQQQKDVDRCPECGCAFQLKYVGEEHAHHH